MLWFFFLYFLLIYCIILFLFTENKPRKFSLDSCKIFLNMYIEKITHVVHSYILCVYLYVIYKIYYILCACSHFPKYILVFFYMLLIYLYKINACIWSYKKYKKKKTGKKEKDSSYKFIIKLYSCLAYLYILYIMYICI